MRRVVVLDQAGWAADQVRRTLSDERLNVFHAAGPDEAGQAMIQEHTALLVLNLCIQPSVELSQLEKIAGKSGCPPLLVLAGCAPLEAAARVLFPRARRVARAPISGDVLRQLLLDAMEDGEETEGSQPGFGPIVGRSAPMQKWYRKVHSAARSHATTLITGETGVGKGLAARAIHDLSERRERPFVVVNCAELTDSLVESELFGHTRGSFTGAIREKAGLFEAADGGTVLLDEVAEASQTVQARLLRAVEDKEIRRVGAVQTRQFDARLIVTTHVDLDERVESGLFRQDLFFRLRILRIHIPPLRRRGDDVLLLADHYLSRCADKDGGPTRYSPLVGEILQGYSWPGNVRELFAALESARTLCSGDVVRASDLPREVTADWTGSVDGRLSAEVIRKALEDADGHRRRAAETLGISRTTLWRFMRDLEIDI